MAAELEVGLEPRLERHDAKLVEPCHLGLGEGLEGKIGQRVASPQAKRLVQELCRTVGALPGELPLTLGEQALEAHEVELAILDPELIAGCGCDQHRRDATSGAIVLEHLAQPRDVHADALQRSRRGLYPRARRSGGRSTPGSFACISSTARTVRCLPPPSASGCPSLTTSSGPRTRKSMTTLARAPA